MKSIMSLKDEYSKETILALEKCQFIEDKLKDCILTALEINRISKSSNFAIRSKDIENKPLGPLIEEFKNINDDTELNNELWNFKDERNNIAHASQLFTLGESEDEDHMLAAIEKMRVRTTQASELHGKILDVFWKLMHQKRALSH
jgi:hypothetical protein